MLHRSGGHSSRRAHPGAGGAASSARVLIAVAPQPRLTNPTRWGWPHWLAPAYKAGGQPTSTHRPLEDYG